MWTPIVLLLLSGGVLSASYTRFKNLQCEVLDREYVYYKECNLKILGRNIVGLNLHAVLSEPLKVAKVNLSFWRKYNTFQPFLFNATLDFCKFMSKADHKLSFEKIFYDALAPKSNVNHSCPYREIIIRKLVFNEDFLKFLPLPTGEYRYKLMASANNDLKSIVYITIMRQEDLMKTG